MQTVFRVRFDEDQRDLWNDLRQRWVDAGGTDALVGIPFSLNTCAAFNFHGSVSTADPTREFISASEAARRIEMISNGAFIVDTKGASQDKRMELQKCWFAIGHGWGRKGNIMIPVGCLRFIRGTTNGLLQQAATKDFQINKRVLSSHRPVDIVQIDAAIRMLKQQAKRKESRIPTPVEPEEFNFDLGQRFRGTHDVFTVTGVRKKKLHVIGEAFGSVDFPMDTAQKLVRGGSWKVLPADEIPNDEPKGEIKFEVGQRIDTGEGRYYTVTKVGGFSVFVKCPNGQKTDFSRTGVVRLIQRGEWKLLPPDEKQDGELKKFDTQIKITKDDLVNDDLDALKKTNQVKVEWNVDTSKYEEAMKATQEKISNSLGILVTWPS